MQNKQVKKGNILTILLIVLSIGAVGLAFWYFVIGRSQLASDQSLGTKTTAEYKPLSKSDDVGSLEGDLNSTAVDNLDTDLKSIDSDLSGI